MFEILSICKGGGYRYCRTSPPHPRANSRGLYPLHRVLMENKLGRLLSPREDVHHKDENKSNDSIDNLVLAGHSEHARIHNPPMRDVYFKCPCGEVSSCPPRQYRQRLRRSKSGVLFCSQECNYRHQRGDLFIPVGFATQPITEKA